MNVVGIGTDLVQVPRFLHWHKKTKKQLLRVFSQQELDDIFQDPVLTAQRFATRFAAKEALFKALSGAFPGVRISLLSLCKCAHVNKTPQVFFDVDWHYLNLSPCNIFVSLSHTEEYALAFVVMTGIHK